MEGVWGISGELLKAGGEIVIEWLFKIHNMIWRTGVAPEDWQRAIIVPIHKKSSRRKRGNYRGISPQSRNRGSRETTNGNNSPGGMGR